MIWVAAIIGLIAGIAFSATAYGTICGGLIGLLLAMAFTHKQRIQQLENQLLQLKALISGDQADLKPPEPASKNNTRDDIPLFIDELDDHELTTSPAQQATTAAPPQTTDGWGRSRATNQAYTASEEPVLTISSSDRISTWIKNFFTEGNVIVRVGMIVLFFGVSFLVKYSIDHALFPIEARLIGVVIGGLVMLGLGWRLKHRRRHYGLLMQGGGIALIYLATFASFKLYQLISAGLAFPLLTAISSIAIVLAVAQNSRSLAVTAITGGFASPILASTGAGSHIALFGYYLVLNLAIFAAAWFRSWRVLNSVGFWFTFIISTFWGVTRYDPQYFASTEPFLIGFFLIYVMIAILFATQQKPQLKGYVDATLVFGVPVVAFCWQAALVHNYPYGLAWSAFALAVFYLALTTILRLCRHAHLRLLSDAMLALGLIFATLSIPFALDGRWSAASWAIEGAGFIWIGIRQQRQLLKAFGMLIQLAGSVLFLYGYPYASTGDVAPFLNTEYLGIVIISLSALVTAYLFGFEKKPHPTVQDAPIAYLVFGLLWWYGGGILQLYQHLESTYPITSYLTFFTLSALLWLLVSLPLRWHIFSFFPWLLLIPLGGLYILAVNHNEPLSTEYGYLVWPAAFGVSYLSYYLANKRHYTLAGSHVLHAVSFILLAAALATELAWQVHQIGLGSYWIAVAMAMVFIGSLQLLNQYRSWPLSFYKAAYQQGAGLTLVFILLLWGIFANFSQFLAPATLPYWPLLNLIDMAQAMALLVVVKWYQQVAQVPWLKENKSLLMGLFGLFCFAWLNVIIFKILHVFAGVPYHYQDWLDSALVQTTLSISWTVVGLVIMVFASKRLQRALWITGASLTAVVVAKLFLMDLAERGTVERILSFMVVGILLLVVGYFSPVPPNRDDPKYVNSES